MNPVQNILHWYLKKRIREIEYFIKFPQETQYNILKQLLNQAKNTIYGKQYGFQSIKNYHDFKNNVPIVTYEKFEPYIRQARKGKKDVTWSGKIKYFAKSSGTTNSNSKFIPISNESLKKCHYKAGKDLLALYINNHANSKIFNFKNLRLGGSSKIYNIFNTKYGDLSAILIENLPFWIEFFNVPNKEISLMSEWEAKLKAIANQIVNEQVVSFTGIPSWMLILLQKVKNIRKIEYLDEIWNNIEVFFHGGINFSPYKKQYDKLFKKSIRYYEVYNASEGFFAIQDQFNSSDLLLLLDYGIFYEFISMDKFMTQNPKIISIESVELHKNYALIISTNGGLWRYIIGDTIKFTSLNPHRIQITGRTQHYINAFGEELMIENAEIALKIVCDKTHSILKEYTAGPIFMKKNQQGSHQWIIEFIKGPENLEIFSKILDQELQKINSDYKAKRYKNIILNSPKIELARNNLFFDWMKQRGKLGGQNKIPRLSNTRIYIDELIKMNNI